MNKIVCETAGHAAGAGQCFDRSGSVITLLLLSMVWLFLLSLLGDLAATWSQSNGILWTATGMDLALLGYFGLLIYKVWFVASLRAVLSEA